MHRGLPAFIPCALQQRMDWRQRMHVFTHRHNVSGTLDALGSAAVQRKLNRTAQCEIEGAAAELHSLTFFVTSGYDAERQRRFCAPAFQPDVERVCSATADSTPHALADQAVIAGATRNGEIEG